MGIFRRGTESFLPDKDYLPLAMPTTDLAVLTLMTRDGGTLRRYGPLTDVLAAATDPQASVRHDAVTANAAGSRDRSGKAGLSIGIVNTLLTALGGKVGLDISATGAASVSYSYAGVTADAIAITALDRWLAGADLGQASRRAADLLVGERLHVVVGALMATGVDVAFTNSHGGDLSLDVPVVQQVVAGSLTVTASTGSTGHVTFTGTSPLCVAAKVARLKADENGFWVDERLVEDGEIRGLGGDLEYLQADELSLG